MTDQADVTERARALALNRLSWSKERGFYYAPDGAFIEWRHVDALLAEGRAPDVERCIHCHRAFTDRDVRHYFGGPND